MPSKRHVAAVAMLVVLSGFVQATIIWRAAVPGIDTVRFVRIARAMDQQGVVPTIRGQREQPLFPLLVWAAHEGLEPALGNSPSLWAMGAQIAAAVAVVLAVVPLYFLACRLVGPGAALAGCVFFCVLPSVSRLGAEGISDSTHLLLFTVAFWAIVEWWLTEESEPARPRPRKAGWLLVAGVATALAVLARAEVLILPAALALAVLAFQCRKRWRQPWHRLAFGAGGFGLGMFLVLGPYLIAVGSTAPGAALARVLGQATTEERPSAELPADSPVWRFDDGGAMAFGVKEPERSIRRRGCLAATLQFGEELARVFGYGVGVLALVGLGQLRRVEARRADRFVQVFFVLFSAAVIVFTSAEGYLSPRHLVLLVVPGVGCAGVGAIALGRLVATWMAGLGRASGATAGLPSGVLSTAKGVPPDRSPTVAGRSASAAAVVVLLVGVPCLVVALKPLHANRSGYREAGRWLAARSEPAGAVLDTLGWTSLDSGRPTYQYDEAKAAFCDPRLAYVVVREEELGRPSDRARSLRYLLKAAGQPLATFPPEADNGIAPAAVVVYRWYPERFRRLAARRVELAAGQRVRR